MKNRVKSSGVIRHGMLRATQSARTVRKWTYSRSTDSSVPNRMTPAPTTFPMVALRESQKGRAISNPAAVGAAIEMPIQAQLTRTISAPTPGSRRPPQHPPVQQHDQRDERDEANQIRGRERAAVRGDA